MASAITTPTPIQMSRNDSPYQGRSVLNRNAFRLLS
jgi:hypothetical protein